MKVLCSFKGVHPTNICEECSLITCLQVAEMLCSFEGEPSTNILRLFTYYNCIIIDNAHLNYVVIAW